MSLTQSHLFELFQGSAINTKIAKLNAESIQGDAVYGVLLYAKPNSEVHRNDGRLRDYWLNKYAPLAESGGLYFSGLDPQNNWESMEWGRFKPNTPRVDSEGKPQKYESPVKPASNRVSYFRVNRATWELVARRYNLLMPENVLTTLEGEALGFWDWVVRHPQIPIILTEGEKKAQCLLSLGFVAIGLPGIWGGRTGQIFLERLHPDLIAVAQKGRKFVILFDYETNPKTKWQVFNATRRTGVCIKASGCECEIALLPGSEKGIDDWVVAQGVKADQAISALLGDALSLGDYQKSFFIPLRGLGTYKPNVRVNVEKLGYAIDKLPESGLVCLQSGMGTGKTWLGEKFRADEPDVRFGNLGHRVALLRNLAKRLKTKMYSCIQVC